MTSLNKALLDTDIYSEVIKSVDPIVVENATNSRRNLGMLTLSTVTAMEIIRGHRKNQSSRKLKAFLAAIALEEVIGFDLTAAEVAGQIAGDLDRIGRTIGVADPMIAAIALTHNLELVTGNMAHFQRIQQLGFPLTLVNWRI